MIGGQAENHAEEVRLLIEDRLGIKGKTLERAVARAGRLLPKWAQRDARYLAQAEQLMGHPKLRLMVDEAKLTKARAALVEHLKSIDPAERRKTKLLGTLGVISFNLILVVAAFITYLVWQGYV